MKLPNSQGHHGNGRNETKFTKPSILSQKQAEVCNVKLEVDDAAHINNDNSNTENTNQTENEGETSSTVNYAAAELFLQKSDENRKKKRKVKNPVKKDYWDDDGGDYFDDRDDDYDYRTADLDFVPGIKEESKNGETKPKKTKIEGNWTCSHCSKKFTREQKYQDHLSVHTGEGLKCKFCPKFFQRPGLRRVHEQLHTKPFKCESCNASFGRKSNLIGHQRIHRGERPYICDLCGKGFPIQSSLLTHKKQSHPDTPKPWFCEFCELRFVSKSQLEIHKRSHTGEKPWICDSCGRGFTTKQNMLDHTRLHNDSMDYQCNVCSQRFKWKQSLERHLMDHTGVRPYPCVQCKLTFKTSNSLKKHGMSVHSDIKHFACQYCGSRFSTSSGVLRHQKKQRCAAIKTMASAEQLKDERQPERRRETPTIATPAASKPVKTEPHFNSLPLFLQEAAHNFQNNPGLHQAMLEKGAGGQGLHQALMEQRNPLALDRQSLSQPLALHRPPPLHTRDAQQIIRSHSPEQVHHTEQLHHLPGRHSPEHSGPPSVERMTPTLGTDRSHGMHGMERGQLEQQINMIGERALAMTVPRPTMSAASQINNYRMME